MKINGYCALFGTIIGAFAGGTCGLISGFDIANFAKTIHENRDTLDFIIQKHPYLTVAATSVSGLVIGGEVLSVLGNSLDSLLKTEFKK